MAFYHQLFYAYYYPLNQPNLKSDRIIPKFTPLDWPAEGDSFNHGTKHRKDITLQIVKHHLSSRQKVLRTETTQGNELEM